MGIYRGAGGTGDAVQDASSQAVITIEARDAAIAAKTAAETAASNASTSATNAATSASGASTSATNAANSASAASTSASNASASASTATTKASEAASSATAAQTAKTGAETAATNSTASAELAQDWATKTSGPVAGGEYSSKYNAQQSASSASASSSSASAASTSATNASNSASAAATSATNAASSATSASGSASTATTQASNASTSASNAASSATSAAGSATTATTQAGLASTSASNAASSASAASTSASNAATSATNASNSASAASTSATNASNSASAAATSEANAAASYDNFDDRYLGPKSSNPSVDNDGNTLLTGALYFNTSSNSMKVWNGSSWLDAYASLSGALIATNNLSDLNSVSTARTNLGVTATGSDTTYAYRANNLSDLASASTARTNLGLGTAATTAATDYATAAQGTKADSALQPAAIGTTVQAYDADLSTIAGLTPTNQYAIIGNGTSWTSAALPATGVTSVTGTSPVASSGGTTPAISLASGYGDTQNPYASKTANYVLAAPNGTAGVPTFRAIAAADIPTLNQNTTGTAANVTGTVAIANGGTGTTTAQGAMDAFAGAVTSGSYLRGNGTNVVMSTIQAADVPTLNQNTTGTASNVTGTVAIANGGTGQTTKAAAYNALTPITTTGDLVVGNGANSATRLAVGTNGQILTSNGTTATWSTPAASSAFPAGTLMLFQQTTAPTGWTKQTTHDNKALRVVSGTAGSGGTSAFTTVFTNQTPSFTGSNGTLAVGAGTLGVSIGTLSVAATTLSTTQIPSHSHTRIAANVTCAGQPGFISSGENLGQQSVSSTGGGGSHTHSLSGSPSISGAPSLSGTISGSNGAITLNVQYVDLIIASKD